MDGIQMSMFEMIPAAKIGTPVWSQEAESADWLMDSFRASVNRGSGFANGKLRIYAAAMLKDKDRLADFIQQEYGVGGNSIPDGFCDYNNRGMIIRKWKSDEQKKFAWWQVRDEVMRQIRNGEFLTEQELKQISGIREKNNGKLPWPTPRMQYGEEN